MRALPYVLSVETVGESKALDLLQEAMERAPQDTLPLALAAWCHGLRGAHNLCARPDLEKAVARRLAESATRFNSRLPLTETILAAAYCVVHDVATAEVHVDRALAIDGGSAWAWARSAWIKAYQGDAPEAIERFQIALSLAPTDPMKSLCFAGVGSALFSATRYDEAIHWFTKALIENPSAAWVNHHLTPACILAGRKELARRSFNEIVRSFPGLTIAQVRAGLPFPSDHLERLSDGLESAGLRDG
jgi:tetratricopeptide (TPR) repeat protein